ncbi:hypothetical protein FQR65_LT16789 [Abscondita terminalis]|nr:hypothetical protein FQR65_LT16789 [Abscondita terminalis]
MATTPSNMLALGTKAPYFELENPLTEASENLEELKGKKGTLLVFMSNHCPFVQHVIDKVVELHEDYQAEGIQVIGINANDLEQSPEDSPEKMLDFIKERNITFPYLYDESQAIAKAYQAACTPDFYLFDDKLDLVYRGQMDESRPVMEMGKAFSHKERILAIMPQFITLLQNYASPTLDLYYSRT